MQVTLIFVNLFDALQIAEGGNQDADAKFRALVAIGTLVSFWKFCDPCTVSPGALIVCLPR